MTTGKGEWVEVDEARAGYRGAMDEGRRPMVEGGGELKEGGWVVS